MFRTRKCKNCGKKIESGWNYCPFCGYLLKDFFEEVEREIGKIFRIPFSRGITITIQSGPSKLTKSQRIATKPKLAKMAKVKIVEEPQTEIKKLNGREIIEIKLPDVKDESDIEINVFEQSIEIKAYAGKKGYFKLIPISPNSEIVAKEFKNNILKLEIATF